MRENEKEGKGGTEEKKMKNERNGKENQVKGVNGEEETNRMYPPTHALIPLLSGAEIHDSLFPAKLLSALKT